MAPRTPNKNQNNNNGSPGKFVKPADLFKMRRNSTKTITLTPANHSNSSNPGANISFHLHSSPLGGFSDQRRLPPMISNSPNFKRISAAQHIEPPSPLKCLSNITEPSPTKNLPTILKNPFDKPVKRKLCLSPKKAIKRSKMLALDEDANLEPPKTRPAASPRKSNSSKNCAINDWTLKTKMKIRFDNYCKNWNETASSTHHRFKQLLDQQSAISQPQDNTISLEAIKNVSTVYQYPYLSWLPLYPRTAATQKKESLSSNNFMKIPQIASTMRNDWCESLDDLTNLLIEGQCPYYYLCSDSYNILFKQNKSHGSVQACISPFSFGMATEFNKLHIAYTFKYPGDDAAESARENSQNTFSSSQSTQPKLNNNTSPERMAPSIDSGHYSELSDDEEDDATRNHDTSQILEGIGLSEEGLNIISKPRGFVAEANSNTQSSSQMAMAIIDGIDNLKKLVKFLKTNRLYTLTNIGRFARLPPTLLAPHQFRYSTPQVPDILMSQNVMERITKSPSKRVSKQQQLPSTGDGISDISPIGPAYIEITGAVLPNLYQELHNLLVVSENKDHKCQATTLESSAPFSRIKF